MAAATGLTFVFDQNIPATVLEILQKSRAQPVERITSLSEMSFACDASDADWMLELGRRGGYCVVTRDGAILEVAVQRQAWRTAGVSLMILGKKWGVQPMHELTRRLLYWWPHMVQAAETGEIGQAWTVPLDIPAPKVRIRLVTDGA